EDDRRDRGDGETRGDRDDAEHERRDAERARRGGGGRGRRLRSGGDVGAAGGGDGESGRFGHASTLPSSAAAGYPVSPRIGRAGSHPVDWAGGRHHPDGTRSRIGAGARLLVKSTLGL